MIPPVQTNKRSKYPYSIEGLEAPPHKTGKFIFISFSWLLNTLSCLKLNLHESPVKKKLMRWRYSQVKEDYCTELLSYKGNSLERQASLLTRAPICKNKFGKYFVPPALTDNNISSTEEHLSCSDLWRLSTIEQKFNCETTENWHQTKLNAKKRNGNNIPNHVVMRKDQSQACPSMRSKVFILNT